MIKSVVEHYGLEEQLIKTTEEAAELIKACDKYRAVVFKKGYILSDKYTEEVVTDNLKEEIAHVFNCIESIIYLARFDSDEILEIIKKSDNISVHRIESQDVSSTESHSEVKTSQKNTSDDTEDKIDAFLRCLFRENDGSNDESGVDTERDNKDSDSSIRLKAYAKRLHDSSENDKDTSDKDDPDIDEIPLDHMMRLVEYRLRIQKILYDESYDDADRFMHGMYLMMKILKLNGPDDEEEIDDVFDTIEKLSIPVDSNHLSKYDEMIHHVTEAYKMYKDLEKAQDEKD